MRISDWSSDVCSSDLDTIAALGVVQNGNSLGGRLGMDRTTVASAPASDKFASNRYTAYVLLLLCFTNAFNLGDRMLIGTLQAPLRLEFRLSDFQLGLLGGPPLAVLYTILGFPIAKWAERGNRVTIIAEIGRAHV